MPKTKALHPRYTVIIQWDEQDQIYVASLPEWGPFCKTHGATYEQAAKNAEEVLELLIKDGKGKPTELPKEKLFQFPGADLINVSDKKIPVRRSKTVTKKAQHA